MKTHCFLRHLLMGVLLCLSTLVRAQGVADKEILLGQSISLTGALAELSKGFTAGADAYFRVVNAAGGVNGRTIRVLTADDGYDPKKALANVQEFERQGVFALWQFVGTGTVREVSAVAATKRIPLLAIATGPRLRAELNPYTFYVRAGNTEELQRIVDHLASTGVKRVAAVYIDAPYGIEAFEAIKNILKAKSASADAAAVPGTLPAMPPARSAESLNLVASASIKTNGDGSEAAARELLSANPQAVVMITVPASSKAFVLAAQKVKLHATIYSLNAGFPIDTVKELGDAAHGVVVCQVMPNVDRPAIPIVRDYRRDYEAAGHKTFTSASLEGYINARILVEALQRSSKPLTRDGLVKSLESMSTLDLGGFIVHFSRSKHGGSKSVELSMSRVGAGGEGFVY